MSSFTLLTLAKTELLLRPQTLREQQFRGLLLLQDQLRHLRQLRGQTFQQLKPTLTGHCGMLQPQVTVCGLEHLLLLLQ
jgi:hypothetical protein